MGEAGGERYNLKNPGVKRILQEVKELQSNPNDDFLSLPLEDNLFEWQFAIRGPKDSEFEGGIYHGRIQLPPEYPFKPPAFMLLTPNGRFETQTKICLSISAHHPEHWQPSWSVRTALVALIAFMPTKPEGALGSLDYTKEERRALAIKSRELVPKYGNAERQKLIEEIHVQIMHKAHPVPPAAPSEEDGSAAAAAATAEAVAVEGETEAAGAQVETPAAAVAEPQAHHHQVEEDEQAEVEEQRRAAPPVASVAVATRPPADYGLTLLAAALAIAIVGILVKKLLRTYGYIDL